MKNKFRSFKDARKFAQSLNLKSNSEWRNYCKSGKKPEELADILEVIYRIAKLRGISKEELEEIRIKKVEKRGGFDKNLFLIDTSKS